MNQPNYVRAGWLIDGKGAPVRKNVLLKIIDGRISALDHFIENKVPSQSQVTDLSSCTIIPPFVDSHVHLSLSGTVHRKSRHQQLLAGYNEISPIIRRHISRHLSHGVLAVRDGGDRGGYVLQYKIHAQENMQLPFALKAAGKAWHKQGRYGNMLGRHPDGGVPLAETYSMESEPIDHVKIINSGMNSLTLFARKTPPQFDRDELHAIFLRAKNDNRKVMVHANGTLPVRLAIEAGCHSIEHGFFMGSDNLQRMAENDVFWVPTAVAMQALLKNSDHIDKCDRAVIEHNLQHQLEQISTARKYGVQIALGTDSGSLGVNHGKAVAEELNLLIQAGFTLPEAIRCTTKNGAQLLGLQGKGVIAKDMPADFLVFDCPPDRLAEHLITPREMYLRGRPWRKKSA